MRVRCNLSQNFAQEVLFFTDLESQVSDSEVSDDFLNDEDSENEIVDELSSKDDDSDEYEGVNREIGKNCFYWRVFSS